jgi:hypothetical protein
MVDFQMAQETFAALANLPSRAGTNMQAQIKAGRGWMGKIHGFLYG